MFFHDVAGVGRGLQPLLRVGQVYGHGQVITGCHVADHVVFFQRWTLGDGNRRDQRPGIGVEAPGQHELAVSPRGSGDEQVIDGHPGALADPLDVIQGKGLEHESAAPAHHDVEGRVATATESVTGGGGQLPAGLGIVFFHFAHIGHALADLGITLYPGSWQVDQGPGHQLELAGGSLRLPVFVALGFRCLAAGQVKFFQQAGCARAVCIGMVHQAHQGDLVVLEALHYPAQPQRLGHIQGPGVDLGHQFTEGLAIAGRGAGDTPQVVVRVEIGVVHPYRVVQAEGHLQGLPAEHGQQVQAPRHAVPEPVVVPAPGNFRGIHDGDLERVHDRARLLLVIQEGTQPIHSAHAGSSQSYNYIHAGIVASSHH